MGQQWMVHLRNGKPEMLFWTMSAQCQLTLIIDNHSSVAMSVGSQGTIECGV